MRITTDWSGTDLDRRETYADRRCGAKLGVYKNRVADNMAQYLVPQECGNKVGVRYAKVTDAREEACSLPGMNCRFPHCLTHRMNWKMQCMHMNCRKSIIRLCVALAQMGVGGDDSWGAPVHPEYHIDVTKPLTLRFGFRGI